MQVRILNLDGKEVGTRPTLAAWEHRAISPALLHQVAVAGMTNRRVSRAHTKDRSERRGGGKKPWRQKGTGRARHGSIRSPLWRKGGRSFGPRADRTYGSRTLASMRKTALAGTIIGKIRDEELLLIDTLPAVTGKTKELESALARLPVRGSTLVLVPGSSDVRKPFLRAGRNIPYVHVADPTSVTVTDMLLHTTIVTTPEGLDVLEKRVIKE